MDSEVPLSPTFGDSVTGSITGKGAENSAQTVSSIKQSLGTTTHLCAFGFFKGGLLCAIWKPWTP